MTRLLLVIAVAAGLLSVALGGLAPVGRIALGWGWPQAALPFLDDPAWRGVAFFRAGDWEGAERSFRDADLPYNRANALVLSQQYVGALEAYDLALFLNNADTQAQANYDLLVSFYAGLALDAGTPMRWGEDKDGATVAAEIARGNARAAGTGDEVTNTGALLGLPEVVSDGARRVRKVFDDKFIIANDRWLTNLEDVPGAFLSERIKAEHKRRKADGSAQTAGEPPW